MNKNKIFLICGVIILFTVYMSISPGAVKSSEGEIDADEITINLLKEGEEILAKGNVFITYDDFKLKGGFSKFNTFTYQIIVEDELEFEFEEYIIYGDYLEGELDKEIFEIINNVRIVSEEIEIKAGELIFDNKKGEAILQENINLVYNEFEATSDKIIYNIKEELVTLKGNVKGNRDGQSFTAEKVIINMRDENISLKGKANLKFIGGEGLE